MEKFSAMLIFILLVSALPAGPAYADSASSGLKEGASSLLIPGWGQYQNGEFKNSSGRLKSGFMIVTEIGAIVTTSVLGGVVGYPVVWVGIGLFIANHVWSSFDAFLSAAKEPGVALGTSPAHDHTDVK